ncbi:MAG: flagellar biosynthetic protein FliR, partial [Thermodesulfobacteriota bacterium]
LILEGVQLAGQCLGYQMGFAVANVIDPQSGAQASVLSQFSYILALIVFLSVNGHYVVLKALRESFELVPPGRLDLAPLVLSEVSRGMSQMFIIAVKIGAPALAVLFCTQVSMGIVAKSVPQMNVLFVGMPLYIVVGLFVFGLSLSFIAPILGQALLQADRTISALLRAM